MKTHARYLMAAVMAAGLAGSAKADAWQDCLGVYSAATAEADADGTLIPSSMTDLRHAADPSAETHGWSFSSTWKAAQKTIKVRTEDVVCHPAEKTLKDEKVIYLSQPTYIKADGTTVITNQALTVPLPCLTNQSENSSFTALLRFRMDADQPNPGQIYFLNMGYGWKKTGVSLRYKLTDNTLHFVYGNSSDNSFESVLPATNAANPSITETWTDLAMVVSATDSTGLVRVGLGQKNGWRWGQVNGYWLSGKRLTPDYLPRLGAYSTTTYASSSGNEVNSFRGSIHFAAFWDRALSDDEIQQVFASPRPMAFRGGCEGYGHEMFAGENGAVATTKLEDQIKLHGSLAAGETTSVDFAVDEGLDGVMQALRVQRTADSAAGELTATIDGTTVGVLQLAENPEALLFVPGGLLAKGSHRLTLTRTDAGTGALSLDLVELGGSWMHGKADSAMTEFAGDGGQIDYKLNWGYTKWAHSKIDGSSASWQRLTIIDDIPAALASKSRFRLEMKPSWINSQNPSQIQLMINDETEPKKIFSYWGRTQTVQTVDFKPGELKAGENAFKFTSFEKGAISFDYVKFSVRGVQRGFTILVR